MALDIDWEIGLQPTREFSRFNVGNSWNQVHIRVQGEHISYEIVHTKYAPHLMLSIFPSVFYP